ncbi:MAG: hypothetical protein RLZZ502_1627 [Pseudomonadota bacterium]|jgi:hypothetical protein
MNPLFEIPDPRVYTNAESANIFNQLAHESLHTDSSVMQEKAENALKIECVRALHNNDVVLLKQALSHPPSFAIQRALVRALSAALDAAGRELADEGLSCHVFAIPLMVVCAAPSAMRIAGEVPDIAELISIMRDKGALRGNQSLSLSPALVNTRVFDLEILPALLSLWQLPMGHLPELGGADMECMGAQESVHLRFLIGTAYASKTADLLTALDTVPWGMPFTQALGKQLSQNGATVLPLPNAPMSPLAALSGGLAAQRAVSLNLFVSNAVRNARASVGEPQAVISAHRVPGGGEIRLSLSNPLDEKGAQGWAAPLYAMDRAHDVVRLITELLGACQVHDVQVLGDIFPDRTPDTGLPLYMKASALAELMQYKLH